MHNVDNLLVCRLARGSIVTVDRTAIGPPIVRGRAQSTTVIVAELDDDEVVGFHLVCKEVGQVMSIKRTQEFTYWLWR